MSELAPTTVSEIQPKKRKRPAAITIVGTVMLLAALFSIGAGAALVYSHAVLSPTQLKEILAADPQHELFTDEGDILVTGILTLVGGIIEFVISISFFRLARWAWVVAITWQALNVLIDLSRFNSGTMDPIDLGLSILLIFLLNQGEVRRVFGIVKNSNEAASQSSFPTGNES